MTANPAPPEGGRVLGLDVGLRRTGIALSDSSRSLATPLSTVTLGLRALVKHICALVAEHGVSLVVIGHPEMRSGRPSAPAQLAEALAERLRAACGVTVCFWEETLTSWEAGEILHGAGRPPRAGRSRALSHRSRPRPGGRGRRGSRAAARAAVDRIAATLILQDYLDAQRGKRSPAEAE